MLVVDRSPGSTSLSGPQSAGLFAGVLLALFLGALDQTILNAALPELANSLHGLERAPWIFSSYLLLSTIATPVSGKLADLFGVKKVLVCATWLFTLSSILCGIAHSMNELIVARAIQGIGGGAMIALCFISIGDLFAVRERGKYQGLLAASFILAAIVGPGLGGWLADTGNWRWIFFLNIPVGIISAVALQVFFPVSSRPLAKATDAFLPLELFQNSLVTISLATVFVSGIGLFGGSLLLALMLQKLMGLSATDTGVALTPLMLVVALSSIIGGFLLAKSGRYKILCIASLALLSCGSLLLATLTSNSPSWLALTYASVGGVGLGLLLPIHAIVIQNVVSESILGIATSLTQFFRSMGGTIGTAMMTGLMLVLLKDGSLQSAVSGACLMYGVVAAATLVLNLFLLEVPLKKVAKVLVILMLCVCSQSPILAATTFESQCDIGKTLRIPVHRWVNPDKPVKGLIVAIPGLVFSGHAYDAMARHLADHGYVVYSTDMRGYGDWVEAKQKFDGDSNVHYSQSKDDLTHVLVALRFQYAGKPIYCMGESFGANYAVWQASTDPKLLDGVIASGLSYKIVMNPRPLWVKTFVVGCAHPKRPQDLRPYLEPILSNDKDATRSRLKDSDTLTHLSATNLVKAVITTKRCVTPTGLAKIPETMPILLIAGKNDKIQKTNRLPEMVKKMGSKQVKLAILPNKGHLLLEQKQIDTEVADLVINWLDEHSSGVPVSTASTVVPTVYP